MQEDFWKDSVSTAKQLQTDLSFFYTVSSVIMQMFIMQFEHNALEV
jgi:hypothetical protein